MPLLSVQGVARQHLFHDRSFALEPGEVVVLSGPTGCGKTRLLRSLADLEPLDAGRVELDGRERTDHSPAAWRRRVAYVPPRSAVFPGTVRENLERIAALVEREDVDLETDLPPLESERNAEQLSNGETQILALRAALLVEPDVLLLDEATENLDPKLRGRVETALVSWCSKGRAILWVSHDSDLAQRVGGRRLSWS